MFFSLITNAQYFETGQDPAHIRWQQINTDNFQIIYPRAYESKAQQLAQLLERVYRYGGQTLHHHPKKISVILHTHTTESNGMVSLAPKRSEFYPAAHQNMYGDSFINQLAVHEFRHVVQIGKMGEMVPSVLKFLLGEHITAAYFGLSLPWWFIEGDAVVTETALSTTGRGRFPPFLMPHKAQVVEKGVFSYDKAYNRSFKDFVPNHYPLGYYLVGNAQKKWGSDLWNTVAEKADKKIFSFNPFNSALKDVTGLKKVGLYNAVFDSLRRKWLLEDSLYQPQNIQVLTKKQRFYTNYLKHTWLDDNTIVAYKNSFNAIPELVKIDVDTRKEEKIIQPGWIYDQSISFNSEQMMWTERKHSLRWQHSGGSVVKIFSLKDNRLLSFFIENKAVAPSFSSDGKQFIAVETDKATNNFLSVYDVKSRQKITSFSDDRNRYFVSPIMTNNQTVVAGVVTGNGFKLATINLTTGNMDWLLEQTFYVLRDILYHDGAVYFVADYNQKMSLYCYNLSTKKLNLIYEPRFGLENPAIIPDGKSISFSDYTADGYRLAKISIDKNNWKLIGFNYAESYALADTLTQRAGSNIDFNLTDSIGYVAKPYKKWKHLFNFHSWGPIDFNTDAYEVKPGISFLSQNMLSTSFLKAGYAYDYFNSSDKYYIDYTYKGWYPEVSLITDFQNRKISYDQINNTVNQAGEIINSDTVKVRSKLKAYNVSLDLSLPLNLSNGKIISVLQPSLQGGFVHYKNSANTSDLLLDGSLGTFSYSLFYSRMLRKSYLDVYTNWGYWMDFNFKHAPFGSIQLANQWSIENVLYVPGLMKNHGIRLYAAYQQRKRKDYQLGFSNQINYTPGWGSLSANTIAAVNTKYKLPLFYPDWSMGSLMYVRRMTAAVLYDCTQYNYNLYDKGAVIGTADNFIYAVGVELLSDVNFLRFYAPAKLGVRTYYLPQKQTFYTNLILTFDFTRF